MNNFSRPTDFFINSIKVDGIEIKGMFLAFELYENLFASAITGSVLVMETSSNQFLADNLIEGNENIEIDLIFPGDEQIIFNGYLNKIANRTVSTTGQITYSLEFVSEFIRQNEQTGISKAYRSRKPLDVVEDSIKRLNENAEYPLKMQISEGDGLPLTFISCGWSPKRIINYLQKHAVPAVRSGSTTYTGDSENRTSEMGKGTGGFLFFETLEGFRFGSTMELLGGKLGQELEKPLQYTLANQMDSMEDTRHYILSYNNVQNNDTQSQQLAGAFRSKMVGLDLDTGIYFEQEWESELATEKQKKTSLSPTRTFNRLLVNEQFSKVCKKTPVNEDDQALKYLQQSEGTLNNFYDSICQLTVPARPDIHPGDTADLIIYEVSKESSGERDKKFSGKWIVSGVAHHALLESTAAYTRLTCIRSTDQLDEQAAETVDLVG